MKAIRTKYYGPGNVRGSRIIATTGERGQRISIPYPHELNSEKAHALAARMLCNQYQWSGELIGGGFPDGTMVWVFAQSSDRA